jgi:signal transduction histidine kinase
MPVLEPSLALLGSLVGVALYFYLSAVALARGLRWLGAALAGGGAALVCYAVALVVQLALSEDSQSARPWLIRGSVLLSLAATGAFAGCASGWVRRRKHEGARGGFYRSLTVALALLAATVWLGRGVLIVYAALLPPLVLFHYIYRYNLFGMIIGRRILFSAGLAGLSAVYLLGMKVVVDTLKDVLPISGTFLELVPILAAAVLWLPLYDWITRVYSRRTAVYADFSERVIEQAATILDLGERVQFLAEGVMKTFRPQGVLLAALGKPNCTRNSGVAHPMPEGELQRLAGLAGQHPEGFVHVVKSGDGPLRERLAASGYNYLFPLRYEDRIIGLLLLDTTPRLYLDENEPVVLSLSRQISHSIEACRLAERKIALEKELLAQEHLAALGNLAATIAHEVKNPLSSIRALAQVMGEDPEVKERYGEDVRHIIGETDRLSGSMRQLLDFARPSPSGRGRVDISAAAANMIRTLEREHGPAGIRLEASIATGLSLEKADSRSVEQILWNLALNAVQACEPPATVRVEVQAAGHGEVRLSVTDEGPGIPLELRERIFEPYFTTKQKGTGLGLAIVRKNVRELGGRLEMESPANGQRGARFTVTLPMPAGGAG